MSLLIPEQNCLQVHCSTCGSPWSVAYLRHFAIFDLGLADSDITAWRVLAVSDRLAVVHRNQFRKVGWEFGLTVLNVIRCPRCVSTAVPDQDHIASKSALEYLFGWDEDGLAEALNELDM